MARKFTGIPACAYTYIHTCVPTRAERGRGGGGREVANQYAGWSAYRVCAGYARYNHVIPLCLPARDLLL